MLNSSSMQIGVTTVNPETTDFTSFAQKLTNETWVSAIKTI